MNNDCIQTITENIRAKDTKIETLGEPKFLSPVLQKKEAGALHSFVCDSEKVLLSVKADYVQQIVKNNEDIPFFELAGPRRKIFFDPSRLKCAVVTCGGLCPGLNDIIRAIVLELYHSYVVRDIYGIPYGLRGFIPKYGHPVRKLTPECVANILNMGGSILGSSRGPQDVDEIIACLEKLDIGILFMVGGDGTLKAACKIANAIQGKGLEISVIGIPKTIDNDIYLVSRSFGFDTAVDVATQSIQGAHNEATGYPNGIGLIKLMGRYSGFLTATTALAKQHANFVLIPEVDFDLEGPNGLLINLENRLKARGHAVIVVAEGAGQRHCRCMPIERDPSGNIRLKDIGLVLKEKILEYFQTRKIEVALKYIDPSYIIRSLPANANDSVFCGFLGRDAVHAGIAGKTRVLIGHWNNQYVHIPMQLSAEKRKQVNPSGKLWRTVLESTGQGSLLNEPC
jgi:6-phosphofructokinase 1